MKRFLKSLLAASLGLVAVVGLVSCGETQQPTEQPTEKTETPAPVFDCANGVHDAATEWSSDNTKHWHACSLCDKLVDKEAHKWGEWTVTKEASLTEKGSRWHECSVCGKKLEEEIPMLEPESIVAAADTAIYVQVPADWETVNCYWWYKGEDGEYGSTTWPGEAMTQVDATNNIWGFVYPKGANMVIFNNGSSQTVDLKFKSTNYYILQAEATDKFDVEQYTTYTPAADQPELNKYATAMPTGPVEVESTTIYAQLPEAWTGHYIYYWGSQGTACPAWPGLELTVVDAAKHLYSAEVPADLGGFCLAEGDGLDQTVDLGLVEGVNAYIIESVADGKDTAKLANYKDGTLTEIVVAIPLPDMNIKGSMNGWADNDAYKFTYDATTDKATFELTVAPGDAFKVAAVGGWSPQFNSQNSTLADGLKAGEGNDLENIVVEKGGKYLITISGCKDQATATCVFTVVEHQEIIVPVPELYVKGAMNGWGAEDAYKLVVDAEADTATLEFVAVYGHEFKVANADWSFEFNAKTATLPEGLSGDGNIVVGATGLYKVVVSGLADKSKATCVITKVFGESSIADVTAAEDGTKVIVAGTVKSIAKWDAYNNFMNLTITDGTNDIYCYNMTGEASLGDMIVLYGEVGSHEGTKQLAKGATIVAKVAGANVIGLEQITSVDQLKDGMQVILGAKHYVSGVANEAGDILTSVELDGDLATSVTNAENLQVITLVKSDANWMLKVGEGKYLYATNANKLWTGDKTDDSAKWTIAITDGVLTITNVSLTDRVIQYNASSPRFAAYKGTQINPQMYIYPEVDAAGKVLSYSGTQNGHAHWNAEAGVFEMELDLKLWGRVSLNYGGTVLTTSTATVTGLFTTAGADWTYNLYTEGDGSTLFCSYNGNVRYYVTYNPTTNTINVALAGIHYKGTWEGQILANEDGEYVFTKEFAQWNRVALYYYGTELTVDNATFSGAIYGPGADWTEKLYYEDADKGLLLCGVTSKPTYQIVYNPKENTVVIDYYFLINSGSIVLNDVTAAVETFKDKATLNSITGYESNFTFSDGVIVRVNDDKTKVTRLELNKNGDGVISFNTGSKITLSVTVKGTGGSNTCVFAVAVNGKYIVANEEAIAMECTAKDTTEAEQTAGVLYSYTESETVIDSKGNEKAGATAENMYATYGGEEVTVTFTIDASAISGGALVEILSPACIQGRGIGITAVSVAVAE